MLQLFALLDADNKIIDICQFGDAGAKHPFKLAAPKPDMSTKDRRWVKVVTVNDHKVDLRTHTKEGPFFSFEKDQVIKKYIISKRSEDQLKVQLRKAQAEVERIDALIKEKQ